MSQKDQARKTTRARLQAAGAEIEWTAQEVAVYLSVSEVFVYNLCHKQQIPHRRIDLPGRERPLFRFRQAEIDAWRAKISEVIAA